ncbi:zinc finger MYM-type protein 5-like [Limulus polyphemus]|uniref:Zinc finger MYM-type protein 5-like n=1 Tax=Limulus polyphemus TaxID=6850 RepID=A0ABM1BFI2_LIMPO|nr:zinc finger MYM-type protein 5-like [Limulus polyphemus]
MRPASSSVAVSAEECAALVDFLIANASKKLAGHENRKRRLQQEKAAKKHQKLSSFFSPKSNSGNNAGSTSSVRSISLDLSSNVCEVKPTEDTEPSEGKNDCAHKSKHHDRICNIVEDLGNNVIAGNSEDFKTKFENFPKRNVNYYDPAAETDHIIMNGPHPMNKQYSFPPKNSDKRSFSVTMMYRKINNGENFLRRWLVYSESSNKSCCFCCKIFGLTNKSFLGKSEINDLKHAREYLQSHENSVHHLECLKKWFETSLRLQINKTIDKEIQSRVEKEREHWCKVLERLMSITLYLAENNLAFRGTSDTLFTPHNGHFLGLVEMLGKFDLTMNEHLRRVVSKETHIHYCDKNVQNEIINADLKSRKKCFS